MSEMNLEEKLCEKLEDSCIKAYKAGQQSQKAKIDELQKQVIQQGQRFNDQSQKLKDAEYVNQKLQGQINKAMVACHESGVLGVFLAIKVEDALRGAND